MFCFPKLINLTEHVIPTGADFGAVIQMAQIKHRWAHKVICMETVRYLPPSFLCIYNVFSPLQSTFLLQNLLSRSINNYNLVLTKKEKSSNLFHINLSILIIKTRKTSERNEMVTVDDDDSTYQTVSVAERLTARRVQARTLPLLRCLI